MMRSIYRMLIGVVCAAAAAVALLVAPAVGAAAVPGYFGVDFTSSTTGWVVGSDSTILRTIDGGQTWTTQYSKAGGPSLLDVCILPDAKTGWAVGASGLILRTTNGSTWTQVFSAALDQTVSYTSVDFVSAKVGWICGGVAAGPMQGLPRGAVYRSDDGGVTWSAPAGVIAGWCPVALDAVSATSATCAGIQRLGTIANGYNAPACLWTTDGKSWGAAATLLRPGVTQSAEIGDLKVVTSGNRVGAIVVGDYCDLLPATPTIFSGANLGAACGYLVPATGPRQLRGLSTPTATTAFAVGSGAASVLKSGNGGVSWSAVATPLGMNLFGVDFVDASNGYAVGRTAVSAAAMVIKTTNGASTWTAVK